MYLLATAIGAVFWAGAAVIHLVIKHGWQEVRDTLWPSFTPPPVPRTPPHPSPLRINPGDNANCTQCGASFFSAGSWNVRCLGCIKLGQQQPQGGNPYQPGQVVSVLSGTPLPIVGPPIRYSRAVYSNRVTIPAATANAIRAANPGNAQQAFLAYAQAQAATLAIQRAGQNIMALLWPGVRGAAARAGVSIDMDYDHQTQDIVFTCSGTEVGRLPRSDIVNGNYKTTFSQIMAQASQRAALLPQGQVYQQAHQQAQSYQQYQGLLQQQYNALAQQHAAQRALPKPSAKPSLATSDQLETFIRYLESEGISETVARKVSLNVFIIWTVAEAEKAEEGAGRATERLTEMVAKLKAEYAPPA